MIHQSSIFNLQFVQFDINTTPPPTDEGHLNASSIMMLDKIVESLNILYDAY